MVWKGVRQIVILSFILLGFTLLLLLPREMQITHVHGFVYTAKFPITLELYKENILSFYHYIRTEKGFGKIGTGIQVSTNSIELFIRSLHIILPCFIVSIAAGIIAGSIQFRFQHKFVGKILTFFNWIFSSIPDFFLYIAIQYLLIKLIYAGLPNFNLYGNDDWYSFLFPTISLAIFPMIHISKFISSSLQQESKKDYVRTSLAKGMAEMQVLLHMVRNCSASLLHQTQIVMLYILSSLPIIEKLSSYHGAGYQLLESIVKNEDNRALALMIPFLFLMLVVVTLAQIIKSKLMPVNRGEA